MAKLTWDASGARIYETGTDRGVLYPKNDSGEYGTGVAWNGLTGVTESPSGADETALYADNIKYLSLYSAEDFGCTIECYTYPEEWALCDGSAEIAEGVMAAQQTRRGFGFSYRTILGNDEKLNDYGYKIHIVYGATASPSDKSYETVNDSPNAITFSYEVKTIPIRFADDAFKPTSVLTIDSTKADEDALEALEAVLYGTTLADPRLPLPDEVIEIMSGGADTGDTSD